MPDMDGWEAKRWMTVPGPFFSGQTDNCHTGMMEAPDLVVYDSDGYEIVYRQPTTPEQVEKILRAAWADPYGGYSWDGDKYWTPESVRDWWTDRGRVREFIEQQWIEEGMAGTPIAGPASRFPTEDARYGLVRYAEDLAGPLESRLRGYLFWLLEGREPRLVESLPTL